MFQIEKSSLSLLGPRRSRIQVHLGGESVLGHWVMVLDLLEEASGMLAGVSWDVLPGKLSP